MRGRGVGFAAALGSAVAWALSSTLVASQSGRLDSLSITAVRSLWTLLFFVVALFALGAAGDLSRMTATDYLQIAGTGLCSQAVAETLYVVAITTLGMSRAFTISIGMYALFAYLLAWSLLDEPITWRIAVGSMLVIAGVVLVALYGRAGTTPPGTRRRRPPIAGGSVPPAGDPPESASLAATLPLVALTAASIRQHRGAVGVLLATGTGLFWAISAVWLRSASEGFDAASVGLVRMAATVPILLLAAGLWRRTALRRGHFTRRQVGILALAGTFGIGLGSLFFIYALSQIGAGRTSILWATAPLFALPMGALFLRERITRWVVIGTAVAVVGVALLT